MFQYDGPLDEVDPEIASIIRNEKERQVRLRALPCPERLHVHAPCRHLVSSAQLRTATLHWTCLV